MWRSRRSPVHVLGSVLAVSALTGSVVAASPSWAMPAPEPVPTPTAPTVPTVPAPVPPQPGEPVPPPVPTTPPPPPPVDQAAATAQCDLSFGKATKRDAALAAALMAGSVRLGNYGTFQLAKNPSWRPVSTLDSSGDAHMHSLHWLLPLLREGVRTGDTAMVARFYVVLRDWTRENPPTGSTRRLAWGPPIYEGYRSLVLTCAAAGPRGTKPWLVQALQLHGAKLADPRRYEGANNASLHQSMGLYALGETLRKPAWRTTASARMARLAERLVHADGSDGEGAPAYAVSNYVWFQDAAERLRRGGDEVPAALARVTNVPSFVAAATRPDGRLEALGDTSPAPLSPTAWRGTVAEYASTLGAKGPRPEQTFGVYTGGYAFGRSGWGEGARAVADETFFSVRAGRKSGIPHAHDDVGSVTLYAHGSPLVLDPGQYRYAYGAMRSFVTSRAAHNLVVVDGARRTGQGTPELVGGRNGDIDVVTSVDRGYAGVTITRTLAYDRAADALVVWDRLQSEQPVRAGQQWGLARGRTVTATPDVASTSGDGADLDLLFAAGGAPLDVVEGSSSPRRGWNSTGYGEIGAAPSLRATQTGTDLSWVTVLAPRPDVSEARSASASATAGPEGLSVLVRTPAASSVLTLDGRTGASRRADAPLVPALRPAQTLVLAGTPVPFLLSGLVPGESATLEAEPLDGTSGWAAVTSGTATPAGTLGLEVPVSTSSRFRVVAGGQTSGEVTVDAAVAPTAPEVTVTPGPDGTATVAWTPPASDGGAPLTGYALSFDGKRQGIAPDQTSVQLTGLVPGPAKVVLTASNAVARSRAARTAVEVPVHPSLQVPFEGRAKAGSVAVLRLAGLMPGTVAVVDARPVGTPAGTAGRAHRVRVRADGTAALRYVFRAPVVLSVTSAGVTSPERAVRIQPKPKPKPKPKR